MQMTEVQYVRSRWFEDISVGEFHVSGTHTSGERNILDFPVVTAPTIANPQTCAEQFVYTATLLPLNGT
jgi:hypothetical protein